MIKHIPYLFALLLCLNCRSEIKSNLNSPKNQQIKETNTEVSDSVFNFIDDKLIGERIVDSNQIGFLKKIYKISLERDFEKPYMWDVFVSSNDTLLQFYQYQKDFKNFTTNVVIINYEDAKYECLLLINENSKKLYNSLIVYENLQSEETYQRISELKNDDIIKLIFKIDNKKTKNQLFQIKDGQFKDYFQTNDSIDKIWSKKEKNDEEYSLKGKINNHLKSGYWIEKRYSLEYGKNIIEDGNYINGVKEGEWNYSPDGPADKVEVFENGQLVRNFYP